MIFAWSGHVMLPVTVGTDGLNLVSKRYTVDSQDAESRIAIAVSGSDPRPRFRRSAGRHRTYWLLLPTTVFTS